MVKRVVKRCDTCQKAKKSININHSTGGTLSVGRPLQQVAVDLVGPMPTTPCGNKWILVLTDRFTRWQDALPLQSATATTIAQALNERVFTYFGLPEVMQSNRGTQFESEIFTELCSL